MRSVDVRFRGNSGHQPDALQCPLMTQSGHRADIRHVCFWYPRDVSSRVLITCSGYEIAKNVRLIL
jgi:hypothetical protein